MKVVKLVPEKEQRTIWFLIAIFTYLIIVAPLTVPFFLSGNTAKLMPLIIILAVITISFVLTMIWLPFYFKSLQYEIDNNEIRMAKGVFWRSRITVPYPKITNVDVTQGPIERLAGIGKVKIETAGYSGASGQKAEMILLGILEFEKIKDMIMRYIRQENKPFAEMVGELSDVDMGDQGVMAEVLDEVKKIRELLEKK